MSNIEFTISNCAIPWIPALQDLPFNVAMRVWEKENIKSNIYDIGWAQGLIPGTNGLVMETGFFRDSCWLDKQGIYKDSSINTPEFLQEVCRYKPSIDIIPIIRSTAANSKYGQPSGEEHWSKHVLLMQNPQDGSCGYNGPYDVNFVHAYETYMQWFIEMCEKYGSDLYVKAHPFVLHMQEMVDTFAKICSKYGCILGVCSMDIIEEAEMVHFWCSTSAVDCWVRGVKYKQYGPGVFMNCPQELGHEIVNFLAWKYCIPLGAPMEQLIETWKIFKHSDSKEYWPLPENLSWAKWMIENVGQYA
jgi:hypothetical protein